MKLIREKLKNGNFQKLTYSKQVNLRGTLHFKYASIGILDAYFEISNIFLLEMCAFDSFVEISVFKMKNMKRVSVL